MKSQQAAEKQCTPPAPDGAGPRRSLMSDRPGPYRWSHSEICTWLDADGYSVPVTIYHSSQHPTATDSRSSLSERSSFCRPLALADPVGVRSARPRSPSSIGGAMAVRTTPSKLRVSLDRSIERMRKQLTEFGPFLGKGKQTRSLEEFDLETERLIEDLLGQASNLLHAYEYAELGEAAEGTGMDSDRQSLLQRGRVLESCVSELEARRSAEPKKAKIGHTLIGPQIAEHMSTEVRSVSQDASLRKAGQLMQQWKLGSLLVTNSQSYVGVMTDSVLAREVVANGLDPTTTVVKTCMRSPV